MDERRPRRALLSDFYGVGLDEDSSRSDSQVSIIDSARFDAGRYFEQLVREQSLVGLLQQERSLRQETTSLDSEMKTLVYENYNKFISATDTIRQMKSNVENMDDEISRLSDSMAGLCARSQAVHDALQPRRDKISQLSRAQELLSKLQFLVELPNRLRQSVELGAYGQAVSYYANTRPVLEQHSGALPSFRAVKEECSQIVNEVCATLTARLEPEANQTPVSVAEAAELIIQAKPETGIEILSKFELWHKAHFDAAEVDFLRKSVDGDAVRLFVSNVLSRLYDCLQSYDRIVALLGTGSGAAGNDGPDLAADERLQAVALRRQEFARTSVVQVQGAVRRLLASPQTSVAVAVAGCQALVGALAGEANRLPELSFGDRPSDLCSAVFNDKISAVFTDLQIALESRIWQAPQTGTVLQLADETAALVCDALSGMAPMLSLGRSKSTAVLRQCVDTPTTMVQVKVQQVFLQMTGMFTALCVPVAAPDNDQPSSLRDQLASSSGLLRLAGLCRTWHGSSVNRIGLHLLGLLETSRTGTTATSPSLDDYAAVKDDLCQTAVHLLERFVRINVDQLTMEFRAVVSGLGDDQQAAFGDRFLSVVSKLKSDCEASFDSASRDNVGANQPAQEDGGGSSHPSSVNRSPRQSTGESGSTAAGMVGLSFSRAQLNVFRPLKPDVSAVECVQAVVWRSIRGFADVVRDTATVSVSTCSQIRTLAGHWRLCLSRTIGLANYAQVELLLDQLIEAAVVDRAMEGTL